MTIPEGYFYTKDHEWLKQEGECYLLGITEFAQSELGELVFIELPKVGQVLTKGKSFCVVESTKAASDVYAPIDAEVVAVHEELKDAPTLINTQPYTDGWIVKVKSSAPIESLGLLSAEQYKALL